MKKERLNIAKLRKDIERVTAENTLSQLRALDPDVSMNKLAFNAARILKGYALEMGEDGKDIPDSALSIIQEFADMAGVDHSELEMAIFQRWQKVRRPVGTALTKTLTEAIDMDPVELSLRRKYPPSIRADMERTYAITRELSSNGTNEFFLSCRTLQAALGHSEHTRAAFILSELVAHGYLVRIGKATRRKAQQYQFVADPD